MVSKILRTVACLAGSLILAGPARAAVVVSDDFDSYGPLTRYDFTAFDDLQVTHGSVDLISSEEFGVYTPSGGRIVDLDGQTAHASRLATGPVSLGPNKTRVTLEFDIRGNPWTSNADGFIWGFLFDSDVQVLEAHASGSSFSRDFGTPRLTNMSFARSLGRNTFWDLYAFTFVVEQPATFRAFLLTDSQDNFGPLIDNFRLSTEVIGVSAAPEPRSWALMILGFAATGAVLRRTGSRALRDDLG